jgi:flavin reductase ActVB
MTTLVTDDVRNFREAMACFPSGVTIVTTTDDQGRWWGFTATSFCSVSTEPPLVLVCLGTSAECHPVFDAARQWAVHIIHPDHADLAVRFATRGADKFDGGSFRTDEHGLPVLEEAYVTLRCSLYMKHPGGDHTILVGRVEGTRIDESRAPAVYFRRGFHTLPAPC